MLLEGLSDRKAEKEGKDNAKAEAKAAPAEKAEKVEATERRRRKITLTHMIKKSFSYFLKGKKLNDFFKLFKYYGSKMVKVTAADVNKLRKATGAGMMDCKKALVEAEGDFDKAIDVLRKKGQKVAAKRADRDSSEGAAIAKVNANNTSGVAIVLGL